MLIRSIPAFLLIVFSIHAACAGVQVLEDLPSRLTLQVDVPAFRVDSLADGARIVADGFSVATQAGAPELPWYQFKIASGPSTPSVSIEAKEWTTVSLPHGLAGVPRWLTPQNPEPFKDPSQFALASHLNPGVSPAGIYRGMPLRTVSLPLGVYDEGQKQARLLKSFLVHVTFGDAKSQPASGAREALQWAGVKNPLGGQYLVTAPRRGILAKQGRVHFTLGDSTLMVRVGDRQLDGFAEDGMMALSFETAVSQVPAIVGARISSLRVYAGPEDTLTNGIDTAVSPLGPTLHEIPIEVRDNNHNGTFDGGDSLLFFVHGTSAWKPIPGAKSPIQWEFGHDPYSFESAYYLNWSGRGDNDPLRLQVNARKAQGQEVTEAPHYLRAEKDLSTGSCDPSSKVDDETGFEWYWFENGLCGNRGPLTLRSQQLQDSTVDSLPGIANDSVWLGVFVFMGDTQNVFTVSMRGDTAVPISPDSGVFGAWYLHTGPGSGSRLGLDSLLWGGGNTRFEGYSVRYPRKLDWTGSSHWVFPASLNRRVSYRVKNGLGVRFLRVENGEGRSWVYPDTSGSDVVFTDSVGDGEDVRYFLYRNPNPVGSQSVSEQSVPTGVTRDLLTGDGSDPEYLIVTPDALLPEALDLAKYRSEGKWSPALRTAVVRTEDIYREWSGGRMSPAAIRDCLRWALLRWGSGGGMGRLRYAVLFGDGNYDYRNIRNVATASKGVMPNWIPPFNLD